MSLLRRYQSSAGAAPQGLEERSDYDENRNTALFRNFSRSKSDLRRPSPMPASPRSSFSSPSSSPRAIPGHRTSGSWLPEDTIEEDVEEQASQPVSSSWAGKVDSAMHNVPFEHDPAGYKSGAFVPQHSIAGQKLNYRVHTTPEGAS